MQRYEKYKDSGIDWLGEIPEHWEVKKVKEVVKLYGRIGFRGYNTSDLVSKGQGAITISPSNIEDWEMKFHKNTYLSWDKYEESPEIQIFNDDILIVKTGSTVGKIGIVKCLEEKATINPQLLVVKNIKLNSDFLYSFLKTTFFYDLIKSNAIGSTIPTISESKIGSLLILQPPLQEQEVITTFLNDKCEKIDAAVDLKEQQIEKLKELRQITIHHTVTKGIPHVKGEVVPTKDSGIDWIGEIPEHWTILSLKHLSRKIVDGTHFTPTYVDSGVPFLRVTDLSNSSIDRKIDWTNVKYIPEIEHKELIKRANPERGDILLSKNGTIGLTRVIDWDEEFSFFVSLCLIKPIEKLSANYFEFFFNCPIVDRQINDGSSRTSVTNLHLEKIKELLIILPPLSEQQEIVSYLDKQTSKIDKTIAQKQEQIIKLKEYKQSLINEVVTGKIKVAG